MMFTSAYNDNCKVSKMLNFSKIATTFVCLFNWVVALCRDTLGSWWDQTQTKCSSQAKKPIFIEVCWPIGLRKCKEGEKQIWRYRMKEKKTMATPNKSSWTILISAFGTRERRFFIQSELPLRLGCLLRYPYFSVTQQAASILIYRGIDTSALIKKIIQTLT